MGAHFEKEIQLRFREADPAGIMFFGNIFALAHDCFEDFVIASGLTWDQWFLTKDYLVPIRHTECDFLRPFRPGGRYHIRASIAKMSDSSFQMRYQFLEGSQTCAQVLMVHTFLDAKTRSKTAIPEHVRQKFSVYRET